MSSVRGRSIGHVAVATFLGLSATAGCESPPSNNGGASTRTSALTLPAPGQKIFLDFKNDALGNPLSRGAVLSEQFAEWGVHFDNGYVLGDRGGDFPDYRSPAPDNLICTFGSSVHGSNVVSWTEGRCAGGAATADLPLVMRLDFKACAMSVVGRGLAVQVPSTAGTVSASGYDATGTLKSSGGSRMINNIPDLTTPGTFKFLSEGVGYTSLPQFFGSNPPPPPQPGMDVVRVVITEQHLGALDDIEVTRCAPLVPRCQDKVVCIERGQQCASPLGATVDNGSYGTDGGTVSLAQTPAGPYQAGATPVTLTVSQGTNTATCTASVIVGDCGPPQMACPPDTTIASTEAQTGCTDFTETATVTGSCGSRQVSRNTNQCLSLGPNVVTYFAASADYAHEATCTTNVTVVERQPLLVTVHDADLRIGPPNGAFHTVTLADCGLTVTDAGTGVPLNPSQYAAAITCVSSDEGRDRRRGRGDIEIVDAHTVRLRADLDGRSDGRVYGIDFQVSDLSGMVAGGHCQVTVPRNPRRSAVDSGARQNVCFNP